MDSARKFTLRGADLLFASTRDLLSCPGASTLDCGFLVARIARAVMAERRTLVFATGKSFTANFVTRRTLAVTTLSIAWMFAATSHIFALLVAVQRLVAGNFLTQGTTAA